MKHKTLVIFIIFALFGAGLLCGCKGKGPATKAGEWVDQAAKDTTNAIGDAGDAVRKTTDNK